MNKLFVIVLLMAALSNTYAQSSHPSLLKWDYSFSTKLATMPFRVIRQRFPDKKETFGNPTNRLLHGNHPLR
ncbi:hypothetical protein HNQ92_003767 [Rhabdobacter roseus]|uniref:Uncharacterized protein n=1 Tax=Rhabdobacter roseus TaxID=1655419 RepID=A0A840TVF1_9BACT|nr:hypothetical protein [Rhabdobacter roseus]